MVPEKTKKEEQKRTAEEEEAGRPQDLDPDTYPLSANLGEPKPTLNTFIVYARDLAVKPFASVV